MHIRIVVTLLLVASTFRSTARGEEQRKARTASPPPFAQCSEMEILRPLRARCVTFGDLSPIIDRRTGVYDARRDSRPWISPEPGGVLEVLAAYVVDNAEGEGWPHGPHGNLYIDFFAPTERLDRMADGADERRIQPPRPLRGPHRTHGTVDEWLDDELLTYRDAGIFRWPPSSGLRDSVILRMWESDSLSEDGFLGRRNDVLGMARVDRRSSLTAEGAWITLRRYSNAHPRRPTRRLSAHLLLRTRAPGSHVRPLTRSEIIERACPAAPPALAQLCGARGPSRTDVDAE